MKYLLILPILVLMLAGIGCNFDDTSNGGTTDDTDGGTTAENLKAAIAGENHEYTEMYPDFAKIAEEENLGQIAARLRSIALAEQHHEERYKKVLAELEAGTVFKKNEETTWICRKCGYEHTGTEAPNECPACGHPQAYYQIKCENY